MSAVCHNTKMSSPGKVQQPYPQLGIVTKKKIIWSHTILTETNLPSSLDESKGVELSALMLSPTRC